MKRPLLILFLAFAAVITAVVLLRPSPNGDGPTPSTALDRGAHAPNPARTDGTPTGAQDHATPDGGSPSTPGSPTPQGTQPTATPTDPAPLEPVAGSSEPTPDAEPLEDPDAEPTVWPASGEGIRGAMDEALPKIRECYERALVGDPNIAGKIVVAFAIGTTDTAAGVGQVTRAGIADATVEQTTMDDCLLDAMEDLQFDPPSDGEMEVNYPFMFSME